MSTQLENLARLVRERRVSRNYKVITVSSGKGGVGKTGISVSLAYYLANFFKKRVLLLDCDIGLGNIHIILNVKPEKNLKSLLSGEKLENVVQKSYNFDVVLGFSGIESFMDFESLESTEFLINIEEALSNYDYVIVDNSAGLNRQTIGFSRIADTTYIVTTPEPTALTDAYAFIKSMYKLYGYSSFKVIVNMCSSRTEGFKTFERLKSSAEKFLNLRLPLAGLVPYSKRLKECLMKKQLIVHAFPSDPFSLELKNITQLETGEIVSVEEPKESLMARLFKFLREGKQQ
jgi:flagellar biosynthesis protein FlhG